MSERKQVDLDPALHAHLSKIHDKNGRTLPGEVEFRLLSTLPANVADKIRKSKVHGKRRRA